MVHDEGGPDEQFLQLFFEDAAAGAKFITDSAGFWSVLEGVVEFIGALNKPRLLDLFNNVPQAWNHMVVTTESPRHLTDYVNNDGLNNKSTTDPRGTNPGNPYTLKKTDYSGAPGLLEALLALPKLAEQLTAAGDLRDAGIVVYAYKRVLAQQWSISQAFAYLRDNNIVGG
jgi:hypothetical protein